MGRKNKTKLFKHGSHSLNASTIGDGDGRLSSSDNHHPDLEVLSSHLRELVSNGTSSAERHKEMKYMFAALEKRDAELVVAKDLIRKLQTGHCGDGDLSIGINEETFCDVQPNHHRVNIVDELEHLKKQNDELFDEREKLASELKETEECVNRLKSDMKSLEGSLEKTCDSLEEGRRTSAEVIGQLEASLKKANKQVHILQTDVEQQKSSYQTVCANLEVEKEHRTRQEELLIKIIQLKEEACGQLQAALQDVADAQDEISVLSATAMEQREDHMLVEQLVLDREKLETRYDSINNGVQLIKKDFDEVKKNLVESRDQIQELQQQLAASKADVKHYRENEDACRKYIRKLEESLSLSQDTTRTDAKELQEKYNNLEEELQKALNLVAFNSESEKKLKEELQMEFESDATETVWDVVKKLRDNFKVEQRKQVFNLAAIEAKEVAYQKVLQQNRNLLENALKSDIQIEESKKLIEDERKKFNEELDSTRKVMKRIRKDKDQSFKKLKNMLAEKSDLLEQNKALEEKLNQSTSSFSNESLISQSPDLLESLEESIQLLNSSLASSEQKLSNITEQLVSKENENRHLQQTVTAYKSKVENYEEDRIKSQKTSSMMESRLVELQRSSEGLQKRFEEDVSMVRSKLESSEAAFEAQLDVTKKQNADNRRLEEEVVTLREKLDAQESERVHKDTLVSFAENEKCKILEENKLLEATLHSVQKSLDEQENANHQIKDEMINLEKAFSNVERQKKELMDEVSQIKSKMMESSVCQTEKETTLEQMNQQLETEVEALRSQVMKQDVEIEKLSTNMIVSNQTLDDLAKTVDQKEKDQERTLQSEKAKFEILSKKLEEKTTESSERMQRLKEKEDKIEDLKVQSEKNLLEMRDKIQQLENELAKVFTEKATMNSQVDHFKLLVAEKHSDIEQLIEDKSDLALKQELLEKEIDQIKKKLEETSSPKKDKILQLENRLEVVQTASKAQLKRLEDELLSTRALLELSSEKAANLEKMTEELRQQSELVNDLKVANELLNEELTRAVELKEVVADLQKQNKEIQSENAEERAGLIDELIDTTQKLAECQKTIDDHLKPIDSTSAESQVHGSKQGSDNGKAVDEMFPSMDPAVRQLVILLSENRNYSYGVLGLVVYAFLVHLYILFN